MRPVRPVVSALASLVALSLAGSLAAQGQLPAPPDILLPAGVRSGLPLVQPNDNRSTAGHRADGVHVVSLEIREADWRIEAPGSPGLRVAAVGEAGRAPSIPAPLIRVERGTRVRVTLRNRLGHPVDVWGLHDRAPGSGSAGGRGETEAGPAPVRRAGTPVEPGEVHTFEFRAGAEGTFMYGVAERDPSFPAGWEDQAGPRVVERDQMVGALVVDPPGGAHGDRILVINIWGQRVPPPAGAPEDARGPYLEGLTINGRSWPYTERLKLEVGRQENWRVINASERFHPMHLHGFYFQVTGRGTAAVDTAYAPEDHRLVVTEPMRPYTTMTMAWTPTRPGRWLFHCHLSFHVANFIRLPGAAEADPEHAHAHMAGLVMGLEVAPGPTDLVASGEVVTMDLYANDYGDEPGYRQGFALEPDAAPDRDGEAPGPLLVFNRYQVGEVTVHNTMSQPTGVHWHGLELDGWADGVPGWSASDGMTSPVIEPGESFTYRLSFLRPGTFIYHSHLDDVRQLTGGLYGPMVVLPEGESFDPTLDHVYTVGWNDPDPQGPASVDVNGRQEQPDARAVTGETHRFRIIHIAPAGQVTAFMTRDGVRIPVRLLAKDGADLPVHQQVEVNALPRMGVGETADFTWTPEAPGVYELSVGYGGMGMHTQRWIVTAEPTGTDGTPEATDGAGVAPTPR